MQYNWFEKSSPLAKIFLMLIIMFCFFFIAIFFSIIIAVPFTHKGISELFNSASNIHDLSNINFLKYLQVVQSIALFIVPPLIVARLFTTKPMHYLNLHYKPTLIAIIIVLILVITSIPLINFLEDINSKMKLPSVLGSLENWMKESEKSAAFLSENFLKGSGMGVLSLNLLMMAVLPALGEELVFRGVFQRLFSELFKNIHWGIIVSAALFSAMHMQFYGFIPRMLLGVIFGYLLIWSGSLWIPIAAHFVNNAFGVIYYYLYYNGTVGNGLQTAGTGSNDQLLVIVSIVCLVILLVLFFRYQKKTVHSSDIIS